jgi:uncharacterized repeat protein (TIGR01451 family)
LNDPIPDTVIDPTTGEVISSPATGTPALLDKWSITRPDLHGSLSATLSAPRRVSAGGALTYTVHVSNHSQFSLNGTQVRLRLANSVSFAGLPDSATLQGNEVVVTIGRVAAGTSHDVSIPVTVAGGSRGEIESVATVTSSMALPVSTKQVETDVR